MVVYSWRCVGLLFSYDYFSILVMIMDRRCPEEFALEKGVKKGVLSALSAYS